MHKCPGKDNWSMTVEDIKCSNCGYDVEMFSDESNIKCPKCKKDVSKNMKSGCFMWCKYYDKCKVMK